MIAIHISYINIVSHSCIIYCSWENCLLRATSM